MKRRTAMVDILNYAQTVEQFSPSDVANLADSRASAANLCRVLALQKKLILVRRGRSGTLAQPPIYKKV